MGFAGRTALGLGKRIGGRPAEIVAQRDPAAHRRADLQGPRRAQGRGDEARPGAVDLRGGAAARDRRAVPRHADQAPGVGAAAARPDRPPGAGRATSARTGASGSSSSTISPPPPPRSARCTRPSGTTGARSRSRSSTPGAGQALISDFNQLSRAGRLFAVLMPGLDVKPMLVELRNRVAEELDYHLEASSQQAFADAYAGDPDIYVPDVITATDHVLVTEWMDGTPLSKIISDGTQRGARPGRDPAGQVPVLGPGPGRAAARGPAPRQFPAAGRRPAGRARLRRR